MSALNRLIEKIQAKTTNKSEAFFYWDRERFVNLLTEYLSERFHYQYYYSIIEDANGNIADALVLDNSHLFAEQVENTEILPFNVEQLIDKHYTNNEDEIILLDLNGKIKDINILYLVDTFQSKDITYSRKLQKAIEFFLDYLIKKKLQFQNSQNMK